MKRERKKRGFTLTEIAIVLGIIGLILGAIWVAAMSVYSNYRTSRAGVQLLTAVQNLKTFYATASAVDTTANIPYPSANLAPGGGTTYIQAQIFPADMVSVSGGTYTIENAWSGSVNVVAASVSTVGDSYAIEFDNIPQAACITLLINNTQAGRDPALYAVDVGNTGTLIIPPGGTGGTVITTSMGAVTAEGLCANTYNNVAFQYRLKS